MSTHPDAAKKNTNPDHKNDSTSKFGQPGTTNHNNPNKNNTPGNHEHDSNKHNPGNHDHKNPNSDQHKHNEKDKSHDATKNDHSSNKYSR